MTDIVDEATELANVLTVTAIKKHKNRVKCGTGSFNCINCGEEIAEARRMAIPGVEFCLSCQEELEN